MIPFAMLMLAQQPAGEVIDLTALADPCRRAAPDEIVVCRRSDDPPYRLTPEMRKGAPPAAPLRLGVTLAPGVDAALVGESVELPGARSQRLMVRLRLAF